MGSPDAHHKYAYTYDKVGNRMTMTVTDSGGARTHVYAYDDIYQITDVNYPVGFDDPSPGSGQALATDTEFNEACPERSERDPAGNRTTVIVDGSETTTYQTNNLNQYTSAGTDSFQYDDSGNMWADGHNVYTFDPENRLLTARPSGQSPPPGSALAEAVDSGLSYTTGGDANWQPASYHPEYYDGDAAIGTAWESETRESWMQTTVEGEGTVTFRWKVSSEWDSDFLEFYVDDVRRAYISGTGGGWAEPPISVTGTGPHTLKWRYVKDEQGSEGDDCGWVDHVRWTGQQPQPEEWDQVEYVYDASGRRIEKKYDGATVYKYIYDGDHCIAEYDGSNNLARKYLYGPAVDEPVCMIEAAGAYAGTYYYHFDALGSVVALSDSSGDTAAVYEYDVYGRVGASDPNHPNRFLFTGREYDQETGLYYYRARYYNPQIGRFLQTDPVGYGAGMNWYAYCGNGPVNRIDPSGLLTFYVYQEYAEGLNFLYELSTGNNGTGPVEWNLAGVASWMGVDPSQLQPAEFAGYGSGYVVRGGSTGYSDSSGTKGQYEEIVTWGRTDYELTETGPLDGAGETDGQEPGVTDAASGRQSSQSTEASGGAWSGFWDAYSKASYGVLNSILGGLFKTECGIPYIMSDAVKKWAQDDAFKSGEAGWDVAEVALVAGAAAKAAGIADTWLGTAGLHGPHHGMGYHFEVILRGTGGKNLKVIIPGKADWIYIGFQ